MKAAQALTTLSAAAASLFCAAALLPVSVVDALSNEERRNLHGADEDATRELMAFVSHYWEIILHLVYLSFFIVETLSRSFFFSHFSEYKTRPSPSYRLFFVHVLLLWWCVFRH